MTNAKQAALTGIEPATSSVTGKRFFQLSYSTMRIVESTYAQPGSVCRRTGTGYHATIRVG